MNSYTMRTYSGRYIDLSDPQPEDICLEDIAQGLGKQCRFNGQCLKFYSVAEHSLHGLTVARHANLSIAAQKAVLLHDASEAYIGDLIWPVKQAMGLETCNSGFEQLEFRFNEAIRKALGFVYHAAVVKTIDNSLLHWERSLLFTTDDQLWHGSDKAMDLSQIVEMRCFTPDDAPRIFYYTAKELLGV